MGIFLILGAGLFGWIIAGVAIIKSVTYRIKEPTESLTEEISRLKKRVAELEKEKTV